jgi:hypothetical protein
MGKARCRRREVARVERERTQERPGSGVPTPERGNDKDFHSALCIPHFALHTSPQMPSTLFIEAQIGNSV